MHPNFRRIYRDQVEQYRAAQTSFLNRGFPFIPRLQWDPLAIAAEAIDTAIVGSGSRREVRPDARLFLLINLHQMVTLPLSHPASPTQLGPDLEGALANDTALILSAAAEQAGERRDMAASHVLRGTAQVLDELQLKSWKLWERDEQ